MLEVRLFPLAPAPRLIVSGDRQIENTHVAEPAEIVQVSALSRQWSLESLYTPAAVPLLVDPHQVAALPLVASPHLPSADDNWDATFILPQLEKLLRGGDIKGGLPAAVSLLVSLAAVVRFPRSLAGKSLTKNLHRVPTGPWQSKMGACLV